MKIMVAGHPWVYAARRPKNDIYEILDQIFAEMSAAGLDAIELMHTALAPDDAVAHIREISQRHRLPVIGTSFGAAMWDRKQHDAILEQVRTVIERVSALGGRTLGTSVGDARQRKTEDQLDDSFLEQIIQSTASEAQLRNAKISLDAVKTYRANNRDFHYTTGHTPQADVRLDVTVAENRVVIFTVAVPHGMLESADIKRFIASYTVK